LRLLFIAIACLRESLRWAISSAIFWAAAERLAAPSRRDRSACALSARPARFSWYAQCVVLPHFASSLNSFSRGIQTSSIRANCFCKASFAVAMTWFFSSNDTSISLISKATCRNSWRRRMSLGAKVAELDDSAADGTAGGWPFTAVPLELFWVLIGAEADATPAGVLLEDRDGSGIGELSASSMRRKSDSCGRCTFASTSLSSVKCLTSSFGRAVIVSAKCVMAGKMSIGRS